MRRKPSSGRWLARQRRDQFVQAARASGYRSRAAFKLIDLDQRFRLLRPGRVVLDLGAAPGGWAQVAAERVGDRGRVVAVDRLHMDPLVGVTVLALELGDEASFEAVEAALGGRRVDLVMSDLAPNMSGVKLADQLRALELAEFGADVAERLLGGGGDLVLKVFDAPGLPELRQRLRGRFGKLRDVKPPASRAESTEHYMVAQGLQGE